jgi:hypothetical protein
MTNEIIQKMIIVLEWRSDAALWCIDKDTDEKKKQLRYNSSILRKDAKHLVEH